MKNHLFYTNLAPCAADEQSCSREMARIFDMAPSDSCMVTLINKLADGTYHTVIAIHALCGPFRAEANKISLVLSLKDAQKNMQTTLVEWKKTRFLK